MVESADIRKAYDKTDSDRSALRLQLSEYFGHLSPNDLVDVMEIIAKGSRQQLKTLAARVNQRLEQVPGGMQLNYQQYTVLFLAYDGDKDAWKNLIRQRLSEKRKK